MISTDNPTAAPAPLPVRSRFFSLHGPRVLWLLILVVHIVGGGGWIWAMPGGFPLDHPRFMANRLLPAIVAITCVGALVLARRQPAAARGMLICLAGMWSAAALTARIAFPVSFALKFALPMAVGTVIALAAWGPALRTVRLSRWTFAGCAASALLGAAFALAQRSPPPSTWPAENVAVAIVEPDAPPDPGLHRISPTATVQPRDGLVTMQSGRYALWVEPLLTFNSRSPDGCWTSLAPRAARIGPARQLVSTEPLSDGIRAAYRDDGRSELTAQARGDGTIALSARTTLDTRVNSHLNGFFQMTLAGHRRLALSFSPCPDTRIEVKHLGYPVGDPARLAYLDAGGTFHIVEASTGEKGPFKTLARGRLERDEALTIELFDGDQPIGWIKLHDWAAQCSTALSPTAGWGLPQNAIEFSLADRAATSGATIFITLSGTSVGRGWDSVAHSPGTYRSRVEVHLEPAAQSAQTTAPEAQ